MPAGPQRSRTAKRRGAVVTDEFRDFTSEIEAILRSLDGNPDGAASRAAALQPKFRKTTRTRRSGISRSKMMEVFLRDGFVDQYSGERLLFPGTLLLLGELLPDVFPKAGPGQGWRVSECHWIYWRLWPTVDHAVPVARAHPNVDVHHLKNLITTSQMMNSAKDVWAPDEAPAPMRFRRIPDDEAARKRWDGMMQWFLDYTARHPDFIKTDPLLRGWHKAALAAIKTPAWAAFAKP
jgi:hypothetical protein